MNGNNFRLVTLGRLVLLDPADQVVNPLSKRKRKLALLAYLALARRGATREQLVEMFWGAQDEQRARHSLSDALSELRGHLGVDAIEARTSDLVLRAAAPLAMDAREFSAACDTRDWARAISLYGGPFLQGVTVEDSSSFEDWVTRERDRLAQLFARACGERLVALKAARDWDAARALAERWLDAAPLSADAALALMESISAPGTAPSAQEAHIAYQRLVARLLRDYDMEPDPRVAGLAARLAETASAATTPPTEEAGVASASAPSPVIPGASGGARPRHALPAWAIATIAVAALGAGSFLLLRHQRPGGSAKPVVAVVMVRSLSRDTGAAWLEDGLAQMITADLSRSPAVDVVAPERVRAVLARGTLQNRPELSAEELRRVGDEVGASWIVTGAFTRGENIYVLDVSLHDIASGRLTRLYTVTGADPLSVADAAAARVLNAADANGPGPRFADVETSSLDAYQHYMRSQQADAQGRLGESRRELDAAVALDSGFVSALEDRLRAALFENDRAALDRLGQAWRKARQRATPWDVQELETQTALHGGEHARAEVLARELVTRFPRDPRAYALLASVYQNHGRWAAADTVLRQELSLDSLATEAGHGPCAPCTAFSGLIGGRLATGRITDAEQAARRWVALQPDIPSPWTDLASCLSFEGRFDEALGAARRAAELASEEPEYVVRIGRILLMARRYGAVDSAFAVWRRTPSPALLEGTLDLKALLERERGQFRASVATLQEITRRFPEDHVLLLEEGNSLGRMGQVDAARRLYQSQALAPPGAPISDVTPGIGLPGDEARAFSWVRALEADAIGDRTDTLELRALADSIARISRLSYYGRDWRLSHHVAGIIAERAGRHAEAAREFQQARWGKAGWTRTNARLAQAQLALGQVDDAIQTLRDAYGAPLDAMGRYQPRSELDFLMSRAFTGAHQLDSAARYAALVRAAWRNADPEIRARLTLLDQP